MISAQNFTSPVKAAKGFTVLECLMVQPSLLMSRLRTIINNQIQAQIESDVVMKWAEPDANDRLRGARLKGMNESILCYIGLNPQDGVVTCFVPYAIYTWLEASFFA